jgi:hypothetical protein
LGNGGLGLHLAQLEIERIDGTLERFLVAVSLLYLRLILRYLGVQLRNLAILRAYLARERRSRLRMRERYAVER